MKKRRNPIPKSWGKTPILFTFQDSPNENLDGEDLRLANLEGTNLSGSSFRNANLEGANLAGCDLSDCDFTGANLDGADLAFAKVDGAIFKDCSVKGAIFFDFVKLFTVSVFEPIDFEKIAGYIDYSYDNQIAPDVDVPETIKALASAIDLELRAQYKELLYTYFDLPELPIENVNSNRIYHSKPLLLKEAPIVTYTYPIRTDPEGYLINPNDQTTTWLVCAEGDKETFDIGDFTTTSEAIDAIGVQDQLVKDGNFTHFAGSIWLFPTGWSRCHPAFTQGSLLLCEVKVKVGDGCRIFDARDLFSSVPTWVTEELEHALIAGDQHDEDLSVFPPNLSKEASDYLNRGDLGETLNLWRSRFNKEAIKVEHPYFGAQNYCETWLEFVIGLFGLNWFIVQHILWKDPASFPLIDYDGPIVGWVERQFTYNALSSE
ncbi:MAG: pentapeptide repeat-containing protein, partial [Candidatus Thorarchaeota archaeon]